MGSGEDELFWLWSFESPQDDVYGSGKPCPPSSLPPGSPRLWPEAGLAFPRVPGPQPSESSSALEAGHPSHPDNTHKWRLPPTTVPGFEGRREGTGWAGNRHWLTSVPTILHPSLPACWRMGGGEGSELSFAEHLLCNRCSPSF